MASRGCVIFVGNLPGDVREREVEDLFAKVPVALVPYFFCCEAQQFPARKMLYQLHRQPFRCCCVVWANSAHRSEESSEATSILVRGVRRPKVEPKADLHGLCGALDSLLVSSGR